MNSPSWVQFLSTLASAVLASLEAVDARLGADKSPRLAARRLRRMDAPRRSAHPWADCRNLAPTSSDTVRNIKSRFLQLNLIALGYPFEPEDEILSYRYEYPSNHYPWRNLAAQGVKLKLIDGVLDDGRPLKWDLEELRDHVTARTKMVALSHVQFVSGFAADLRALGSFCKERGIKLVVDATQSVGCMPVYPEQVGIDALVVSGWKWLMGPLGTALLYTSPTFRPLIKSVLTGPSMMAQGENYLDHSFNPVASGGRFEFSTLPPSMVAALGTVIERVINRSGIEGVWNKVQSLQNALRAELDSSALRLVPLSQNERSGILSFSVEGDATRVVSFLKNDGIICSARGMPDGKVYIRCAPHFYLSEHEVRRAARALGDAVQLARAVSGDDIAANQIRP